MFPGGNRENVSIKDSALEDRIAGSNLGSPGTTRNGRFRRILLVVLRAGEGRLTLMSEVKGRGSDLAFRLTAGSVSRNCNWLHRAGDGALRRRSIKLLFAGSAFRVSVSGLVLCLKGGRRAQAWPRS